MNLFPLGTRLSPLFLLGLFLHPSHAQGQVDRYNLLLTTTGGVCSADAPDVSCVRYNGDSALYPFGESLPIDADFGSAVGNNVPITLPGFYLPDVVQAFDTITIEATGEVSGPPPSGTWNIATGTISLDLGPVDFPEVVQGGAIVDPFDMVTAPLAGNVVCEQTIPPMTGAPLSPGGTVNPGDVTIVGRSCVTRPNTSLNESFFVVLRGTMVPEPSAALGIVSCLFGLSLVGWGRRSGRS